jgi:hypothetical protein
MAEKKGCFSIDNDGDETGDLREPIAGEQVQESKGLHMETFRHDLHTCLPN